MPVDDQIAWQDQAPTPDRSIWVPIISPKPRETKRAVILSPRTLGVLTHYVEDRTTPCLGKRCEWCKSGRSTRWKGYLGCWDGQIDRLVVFEVTTGAVEDCPALGDPKVDLRGMIITSSRPSKSPNGRVRITLERVQLRVDLRPDFDVRAALLRVWGMMPPVVGATNRRKRKAVKS